MCSFTRSPLVNTSPIYSKFKCLDFKGTWKDSNDFSSVIQGQKLCILLYHWRSFGDYRSRSLGGCIRIDELKNENRA